MINTMSDMFPKFEDMKVTATQKNGVCEITPWNRKYTASNSPFLSSIISAGEEMLAAPMRLVGLEDRKELVLNGMKSDLMYNQPVEDAVGISQYMTGSRFLFNIAFTVEEDGMMDCRLTIAPNGKNVNQVFGLETPDTSDRELNSLWLEIPLKKSVATHYQIAPADTNNMLINGKEPEALQYIRASGKMPSESLSLPFLQQLFVGNDDIGFSVFFESKRYWQVEDNKKAIECIVNDDQVIVRIHLLDKEPREWLNKGTDGGLNLPPISFRFGMMVTPVKPFPKNPYVEHSLHIDCFKKLPNNYEEFLFEDFENTGEMTLDRIARLGVNTLYLHEKWNDMQNSPFLTETAANRLRLIVEEAHKRGIKVIPYFGYELSTLSPIYATKSEEYLSGLNPRGGWWRVPWQRALRVCYNSGWQDLFVDGLEKLIEDFNFDGFYFDSIISGSLCDNERHGCGYRDHDENLHGTYTIFPARNFMKRIYKIAKKHGGIVSSHSFGAFPMATIAYTDTYWEGESAQNQFLKGLLDKCPEDFYRSIYSGRNIGSHINMLCYSNPPIWTFSQALSNALPHGVIPKPVDTGEPLEIMSKLWKILDSFDIEHSAWKPYYTNDAKVSTDDVRLSYYENDKELLCFVSNMVKSPVDNVEISLPLKDCKIVDAESGDTIASGNSFTIDIDSFAYKIFRVTK